GELGHPLLSSFNHAIPVPTWDFHHKSSISLYSETTDHESSDSPSTTTAGSCCVRQWSVPRPQTRSTAWMPTTRRPGKRSASVLRAFRSLGSLNVGTSTKLLPI